MNPNSNPLAVLATFIYDITHGNECRIECNNEIERITKTAVQKGDKFLYWGRVRKLTKNNAEANAMCEIIHEKTGLNISDNGVLRYK